MVEKKKKCCKNEISAHLWICLIIFSKPICRTKPVSQDSAHLVEWTSECDKDLREHFVRTRTFLFSTPFVSPLGTSLLQHITVLTTSQWEVLGGLRLMPRWYSECNGPLWINLNLPRLQRSTLHFKEAYGWIYSLPMKWNSWNISLILIKLHGM